MELQALTGTELVAKYNETTKITGDRPVNKFPDKKTAVRRVEQAFQKVADLEGEALEDAGTDKMSPAPKRRINFLGMRQEIKASESQRQLKRKGSIRAQALEVLKSGATLEELDAIFKAHDKRRGREHRDPVYRAYEMVRIFCYHYGYGTQSSEDGTVVKLVTE